MVKNNMMYFWRIMFTYIIALHHLRNCFEKTTSWYIAVDFFAITSGFLLMHHVITHSDESLWEYTKKRFFQFFPLIFITSMIRVAVETWYHPSSFSAVCGRIVHAIPDYLLMNAYYVSPSLNSVDWYIQMLFTISIPLFYLLKKHQEFTVKFLAPICALIAYSYIFKEFNYLEGYAVQGKILSGVVNMPLIRIGGGVMLGVLGYFWVQKISDLPNFLRNIIEVFCLGAVIYLAKKHGKDPVEFIYVLLLFCGICFAFCHQVKWGFFKSKFIRFLSQLSIYIYLCHYFIRIIFRQEFSNYSIPMAFAYLLIVTLFSSGLYYLVTIVSGQLKKWSKKYA